MQDEWQRLRRALEQSAALKRRTRDLSSVAKELRSIAAERGANIQRELQRYAAMQKPRLTVLTIDDDAEANEVIAATSAVLGLDCEASTAADTVVRQLRAALPAAVLASPRFPAAIDAAVRADGPVILTPSSDEMPLAFRAPYRDSVKGVLVRPFEPEQLLEVIGTLAVVKLSSS